MSRAVQHGLMIIAEAAKHLPQELKSSNPEIPWSEINGLSDTFCVTSTTGSIQNLLWSVVQNDLEPLDLVVVIEIEKRSTE